MVLRIRSVILDRLNLNNHNATNGVGRDPETKKIRTGTALDLLHNGYRVHDSHKSNSHIVSYFECKNN